LATMVGIKYITDRMMNNRIRLTRQVRPLDMGGAPFDTLKFSLS
jgi:hypothetical protein